MFRSTGTFLDNVQHCQYFREFFAQLKLLRFFCNIYKHFEHLQSFCNISKYSVFCNFCGKIYNIFIRHFQQFSRHMVPLKNDIFRNDTLRHIYIVNSNYLRQAIEKRFCSSCLTCCHCHLKYIRCPKNYPYTKIIQSKSYDEKRERMLQRQKRSITLCDIL